MLLYWMLCSLRRSLRRVRSSTRLYEALAEREKDEASRELYRMLANEERSRITRKASTLFNLGMQLPADRDPLYAWAWRRLLVLCGPRVAVAWIEWRETRELTVIILVARTITLLTAQRSRSTGLLRR